jgi:hypothetical protein
LLTFIVGFCFVSFHLGNKPTLEFDSHLANSHQSTKMFTSDSSSSGDDLPPHHTNHNRMNVESSEEKSYERSEDMDEMDHHRDPKRLGNFESQTMSSFRLMDEEGNTNTGESEIFKEKFQTGDQAAAAAEEHGSCNMDTSGFNLGKTRSEERSIGKCHYPFPNRLSPPKGYLAEVDFYFFRDVLSDLQQCYLTCIDDELYGSESEKENINERLLESVQLGVTDVVRHLLEKYPNDLDPLYTITTADSKDGEPVARMHALNAIQEAIHGGYAEIVKLLTKGDYDIVIDTFGRTVKDYIQLKGSPVRPRIAKVVLGLDVDESVFVDTTSRTAQARRNLREDVDQWNSTTSFEWEDTCDIDVHYGEMSFEKFYRDYYITGRPLVLRNHAPQTEIDLFSKKVLDNTPHFNLQTEHRVGPTAYPSLTNQEYCRSKMTLAQIENATECPNNPGIPMVHAWHPTQNHLHELFPLYNGKPLDRRGGWRTIRGWFGPMSVHVSRWQFFFGGDESGATYHWHEAAFNILYVGVKEWRIGPPIYKGWTGMPARQAAETLDPSFTLKFTQRPGDQIFIPNYWGHMTMNHGFTLGAALVLSEDMQRDGLERMLNFQKNGNFNEDLDAAIMSLEEVIEKEEDKVSAKTGVDTFAREVVKTTKKQGTNAHRVFHGRDKVDGGGRSVRTIETPLKSILGGTDERSRAVGGLRGVKKHPSFLFVHINKTGGTSLIKMLRQRCGKEYVSETWTKELHHRSFHATAHSYIDHYGRSVWDNAYSFAVVRHPLARQVSNFFFLVDTCISNGNRICEERHIQTHIDGVSINELSDEMKIQSFHEWMERMYESFPPGRKLHHLFGSTGHGNEEFDTFSSTQTSWMVDPEGNMAVKSVFKLETLSDDMIELAEQIPCLKEQGPRGGGVTNSNTVEMIKSNAAPNYPHYMLFAENERTRAIMNEVFAVDFQNFGYDL